jgi:protein-tyrosine phosphatase
VAVNCSRILPRLLVGSCPIDAEDVARLGELGVTAVINVQTDEDFSYWSIQWDVLEAGYVENRIEIHRIPVRDFDHDALRRGLPKCVCALDELMRSGHTVYVHCSAGINRSPSTVIAYLYWIEGQDLDEAAAHVMQCRCCDPYLDAIKLATEDRQKAS